MLSCRREAKTACIQDRRCDPFGGVLSVLSSGALFGYDSTRTIYPVSSGLGGPLIHGRKATSSSCFAPRSRTEGIGGTASIELFATGLKEALAQPVEMADAL